MPYPDDNSAYSPPIASVWNMMRARRPAPTQAVPRSDALFFEGSSSVGIAPCWSANSEALTSTRCLRRRTCEIGFDLRCWCSAHLQSPLRPLERAEIVETSTDEIGFDACHALLLGGGQLRK